MFNRAVFNGGILVLFVLCASALAEPRYNPDDTERKRLLPDRPLKGHEDGVMSVVFFPDSIRAASASHDGTVRIWDVTTGELLRTIKAHKDGAFCVSVSPDSKWIASGGTDHLVKVWEVKTGELISQMEGHTGIVRGAAFLPDGTLLTGGSDGLRLWNANEEKLLWRSDDRTPVWTLTVTADGSRCALLCTSDAQAHVWDLKKKVPLGAFGGWRNLRDGIGISQDGRTLIGHSGDNGLELTSWDIKSGESRKLDTRRSSKAIVFSQDGRRAVALRLFCSEVFDTDHWDMPILLFDQSAYDHAFGEIQRCVAISPDGARLLVGGGGLESNDGWRPGRANEIAVFTLPNEIRSPAPKPAVNAPK